MNKSVSLFGVSDSSIFDDVRTFFGLEARYDNHLLEVIFSSCDERGTKRPLCVPLSETGTSLRKLGCALHSNKLGDILILTNKGLVIHYYLVHAFQARTKGIYRKWRREYERDHLGDQKYTASYLQHDVPAHAHVSSNELHDFARNKMYDSTRKFFNIDITVEALRVVYSSFALLNPKHPSIISGLRCPVKIAYGNPVKKELFSLGLVENGASSYILTRRGLHVASYLFCGFWRGEGNDPYQPLAEMPMEHRRWLAVYHKDAIDAVNYRNTGTYSQNTVLEKARARRKEKSAAVPKENSLQGLVREFRTNLYNHPRIDRFTWRAFVFTWKKWWAGTAPEIRIVNSEFVRSMEDLGWSSRDQERSDAMWRESNLLAFWLCPTGILNGVDLHDKVMKRMGKSTSDKKLKRLVREVSLNEAKR